jgi:uncharacterized protein (DUF427 family)
MKSPGIRKNPEHKLSTERMKERVEVFMDGQKVAETKNAIKLFEDGYEPRIYVPKEDIHDIELLKFDGYECPFKGHAELYSVKHGSHRYENAAWSYEDPYEEFQELKGRVAFYPEKVQEIRVTG